MSLSTTYLFREEIQYCYTNTEVSADTMSCPKAASLEKALKTLPHEELELLLRRMGPASPTGVPPDPNRIDPNAVKKDAILPHASSTMYTITQKVNPVESYENYVKQSVRNGLKQPMVHDETNPQNWKSLYSNTFRSKERDALEIFTEQNSELGKREDRDEYWGALSNPGKIVHSGVNSIDRALKEKVAVFSRFRYNPLETLSKIFTDFDTMHTGKIKEADFVYAVGLKLNFTEYSGELRALFRRHDLDHKGELESEEFINSLFNQNSTDPNHIISTIRELLELQPGGFYGLKAALSRCGMEDSSGTGLLDPSFVIKTLDTILAPHRVQITPEDYRRLFKNFVDEYGYVKYKLLIFAIRGYMDPIRRGLVEQAFGTFETDQWNRALVSTLRAKYDVTEHPRVLNGTMSKVEAEVEFMSNLESREDEPIGKEDFITMYDWISANVPDTADFLPMIRKPWHLKGDVVNVGCRRALVWHSNGGEEIFELSADVPLSPNKGFLRSYLKRRGVLDIADVRII